METCTRELGWESRRREAKEEAGKGENKEEEEEQKREIDGNKEVAEE